MPKKLTVLFISALMLALLLVALGCGSGDTAESRRPGYVVDYITGEDGSAGSPTGGGGGGGGIAAGACVVSIASQCYQGTGVDQAYCDSLAGFGTYYSGQSCASTSYPNCVDMGGGFYLCTP